jgi:hypothetical protein
MPGLAGLAHAAFPETARDLEDAEAAANLWFHVEGECMLGGCG